MRSQHLWTPRIWNTSPPIVQGRAPRKLSGGLQPYRKRIVISQEFLTRWIARLRTSIPRQRCWTCLTCRTANLKPSNVILSSACGNSKCYLMRLRITLKRSIRQQGDILSPCHPISTRINHVAHDDKGCSTPVEQVGCYREGCPARMSRFLLSNSASVSVFCA